MKNMLFLVWLLPNLLWGQVGQLNFDQLGTYAEQARQAWHIPGMAIAVVKDGKLVYAKGFGVRDVQSQKPITEHSLFAIASNTKAFTAAALAKLISEGKAQWDDPVRKYLPWFELYDPWVSHHLTLRDALAHNSGLKTFSGDLLWYETTYNTEEVVRRARFLEPSFGFRAGFGYQNLLFAAAGLVIEKLSGQPWAEYVQQNFLTPLHMTNTNTSVKAFRPNDDVALPHHVLPDGNAQVIDYLPWDNAPAAAAINSSVHDMAQWMLMQLANGRFEEKQLVSEKELLFLRQLQTPNRVAPQPNPKTNFKGYGLGWEVYDYYGHQVIGHGGGSDGMISKVVLVPDQQFGFVVLTNSINWLPSALTYWILDAYLGQPTKDYAREYLDYKNEREQTEAQAYRDARAKRKPDAKPSLALEQYAGSYHSELYGEVQVRHHKGALSVHFMPAPDLVGDLSHWEHNSFEIRLRHTPLLPHGRVNFELGFDGRPRQLYISIPNPDFYFEELVLLRRD